jgi:transposase
MVVVGVDPHKHNHTLVAVDGTGRRLGSLTVPADKGGHLRAYRWAARFSGARRWGVEDGRHVAARLVADVVAAGEQVVMVPPKLMAATRASARTRGKSDPIDALAVARAVLREPDLAPAQLDDDSLSVRLLVDHREDLVAERTRMINRLRWHLVTLAPDLEPTTNTMTRIKTLRVLADQLSQLPPCPRRDVAVELVQRILTDTVRINQLERQIRDRVAPLAPRLLSLPGCSTLTAAKLVGEVAGITRFRNSAQLASLAGTACIPVWTGNREKHRLNRGGNRQLNAALHRIAITQLRIRPETRALYERRRAHGDTNAGALRVLKRHLTDIVFHHMTHDHQQAQTVTAQTAT